MDQRIRIDVHEAVEPYARLVVSGTALNEASNILATIYGPKCAYARTLPTTFPLAKSDEGAIEFLVQDPCYWTPTLPFLYELAVEWTNVAGEVCQEHISFALRRLTPRGGSLYLEGKRFVPRGVHGDAVTPEILEQVRSAEIALMTPNPVAEDIERANVHGIPIVADLRTGNPGQAAWLSGGIAFAPSVLFTILDPRQLDEMGPNAIPHDSLVAISVRPESIRHELAALPPRFLVAMELRAGDRAPAWAADCGHPVIAIRHAATYADFQAGRAECDRLQADLAPHFDLAGYFV